MHHSGPLGIPQAEMVRPISATLVIVQVCHRQHKLSIAFQGVNGWCHTTCSGQLLTHLLWQLHRLGEHCTRVHWTYKIHLQDCMHNAMYVQYNTIMFMYYVCTCIITYSMHRNILYIHMHII